MKSQNQNLAVVYGGYSSEVDISVKSGKSVAQWLRNAGRNVYEILLVQDGWWALVPAGDGGEIRLPIDRNDFSFISGSGEKISFGKVFVVIHGDPGENGRLQAYFELLGITCIGCSSQCATIAFDKFACKSYLRDSGVCLAKDIMLRRGEDYDPEEIAASTGLPAFVKPCGGGSSFGVTKVRRPWLFIFYTACIWACYYLHFYLTFYCFGFLSGLGGMAGLVLCVLGSFAVIVPTPNGAGPWHYVVIVGLMMYGISRPDAGLFALVVHTIQTFLVVAMGIVSLFLLQFRKA